MNVVSNSLWFFYCRECHFYSSALAWDDEKDRILLIRQFLQRFFCYCCCRLYTQTILRREMRTQRMDMKTAFKMMVERIEGWAALFMMKQFSQCDGKLRVGRFSENFFDDIWQMSVFFFVLIPLFFSLEQNQSFFINDNEIHSKNGICF